MQYILKNPYTWLFVSALVGAMLVCICSQRKRKASIYLILFLLAVTIGLAYVGGIWIGDRWVMGRTPLWIYYLGALVVNTIVIFSINRSYMLILLGITCVLSLMIALDRWWVKIPFEEDGAVLGIYNYDLLHDGLDLAILHEPEEEVDKSRIATYWQHVAPMANLAFSYASYPKGDVRYDLEGYRLHVPPEFFFIPHSSYLYPTAFSTFNNDSNVKKSPPLLLWLKVFFDITTDSWHKEAPWVSESTPVLFYSSDFTDK